MERGRQRSPITHVAWAAWLMLLLGAAVVFHNLYTLHSAGLEPLEGWDVCKPRDDQTVVDCIDPADVPNLWPHAFIAAGIALAGVLLLLGVVVHKLRTHAADVSRATGT